VRRIYRNPPLIEALCELQFQPGQPWDWTIPGRIYERVQQEYPKRREMNVLEVDLRAAGTEIEQEVKGGVARMLFLRDDERGVIQVGHNVLAVNQLEPYSNWETFRKMIEQALGVYAEIAQPAQIRRIGLRYINRIKLPSVSEAGQFVLFLPQVPEAVPHPPASWAIRVDIPYSVCEHLRLQSAVLIDVPAILLDIEFATEEPYNPFEHEWRAWLERAHSEIEQVFEATITPVARKAFEEERHDE